MLKDIANALAKQLVFHCFRNTSIEGLHTGVFPVSKAGDYSDVKVIDGGGNVIPWNELSRISDPEMCCLNKEAVNKVYTLLLYLKHPVISHFLKFGPVDWDDSQLDKDFTEVIKLFSKQEGYNY